MHTCTNTLNRLKGFFSAGRCAHNSHSNGCPIFVALLFGIMKIIEELISSAKFNCGARYEAKYYGQRFRCFLPAKIISSRLGLPSRTESMIRIQHLNFQPGLSYFRPFPVELVRKCTSLVIYGDIIYEPKNSIILRFDKRNSILT